MGRLIIHIGLHKTATTYLQYNFFSSLEKISYIHGSRFFEQWKQQAPARNVDLLLSYEGFSGNAWNEDWKRGFPNEHNWLTSFEDNIISLKQAFPNAIILVFFRKHQDLLISMYKQYIQEGGVLELDQFYGAGGVIKPQDLSFEKRIKLIREHFESCYFLNYETFRAEGNSYLTNFFKTIFDVDIKAEFNPGSTQANYSISGSKVSYLRHINNYYQRLPKKIKGLLRSTHWSPRDIMQQRLSFWRPQDPVEFQQIKDQIKIDFSEDWFFFEKHQWIRSL
jgi:hypothetical protein